LMQLRRGTDSEQKAAKDAEKRARAEAKERERAASEDQKRLRSLYAAREAQLKAFNESAAGQARAAYARQDRLFQFFIDVKDTKPVVVPLGPATTQSKTSDPVAILNAVCNEGWELVNGSFVFHELGSESRDKFLASGQNVAVRGTVIGYYLFRHCPENRCDTRDPWDVPAMNRVCPHCGVEIDAEAQICPACHSASQAWQFAHGSWWMLVGDKWHSRDETTEEWAKYPEDDTDARVGPTGQAEGSSGAGADDLSEGVTQGEQEMGPPAGAREHGTSGTV
jgi:hypothetical protein